ncbi:MAG: hypothetical protein AB8G96_16400 [Phycisphaerales bacterium]
MHPPAPPPPDPRLARPWRRFFFVYWLALTAGTHWPNFTFSEEMPASDKSLHLMGFAGLTILLWRTRWIRSLWACMAVAFAWAVADELTQGLPGLNRHVGASDIVANGLGCTLAGAWIAALGPVGGLAAHWRSAMLRATLDRVFLRVGPWLAVGGLFGSVVAAYVGARMVDLSGITGDAMSRGEAGRLLVILIAVAGAHVVALLLMRWWTAEIERARDAGICVACARDCPLDSPDANPMEPGACGTCAAPTWPAAWMLISPARLPSMLRAARRPGIVMMLALVGIGLLTVGGSWMLRWGLETPLDGAARTVTGWLRRVPNTLELTIDVWVGGMLLAWMVRWSRGRLAAEFDAPSGCRQCGQDLRATPTEQGLGRCSECGTGFVRLGEPN